MKSVYNKSHKSEGKEDQRFYANDPNTNTDIYRNLGLNRLLYGNILSATPILSINYSFLSEWSTSAPRILWIQVKYIPEGLYPNTKIDLQFEEISPDLKHFAGQYTVQDVCGSKIILYITPEVRKKMTGLPLKGWGVQTSGWMGYSTPGRDPRYFPYSDNPCTMDDFHINSF